MKFSRSFVANHAVWTHLIVVSTPSLAFSARLVEALEPIRVQALCAELAVQAFDEELSVGLPGREKSNVTPRTKAQRSRSLLMNSGPLSTRIVFRQASLMDRAFERRYDIKALVSLTHINDGRQPRERVNDGKHTDLAPVK